MDDRLKAVECALADVVQRLAEVETRLAAIEATVLGAPPAIQPEPGSPQAAATAREKVWLSSTLAIVGRTFLILAGAFLLRTATEGGLLPGGPGVALGLAYAVVLIVLADRAALLRRELSAWAHGAAAMVVGLPLIYEATVRFGVLSAETSAGALVIFAGLALAVAARRGLAPVAWFATLGALATTVALLIRTHHIAPLSAVLVLLGLATAWLRYDPRWRGLRWFAAACADVFLLQAVFIASSADGLPEAYRDLPVGAVEGLAVLAAAAYVGTFVFQALAGWVRVGPFEIAQTAASLGVGLWGAVQIAELHRGSTRSYGVACLLIAAAAVSTALALRSRPGVAGSALAYVASIGVVLALVGSSHLLTGLAITILLTVLAIVAVGLARYLSLAAPGAFAAVFLLAAALQSGLAGGVWWAFGASTGQACLTLSLPAWLVVAAAVACYLALTLRVPEPVEGWPLRLPQLIAAMIALAGCGAAVIMATLVSVETGDHQAALAAALRTTVLCAAALLLAALGRDPSPRELTWPVLPLIGLTGIKLLVEDLPHGRAASLFVAFVAFGAALILCPRLIKQGRAGASGP